MEKINLAGFRDNKSILPNFRFIGEFTSTGNIYKGLENINPWHIRSVSYENHTFKQEGQYHGPGILKTFPVLDRGENGAYLLRVTMEEDKESTILSFIENLKAGIINEDGIYNTIKEIKSLQFILTILTQPNYKLTFEELYFLTSEQSEFSYSDSDIKIHTITFAYDNFRIAVFR